MAQEIFSLTVNGASHELAADPATPLIYILRNDLGLKSVRFGCGAEQCGACHVIADGEAVPSCAAPAGTFIGKDITTLEGLATDARLTPLQEVFLEHNAAQCGYCLSGILMTAKALLDRVAKPTEKKLRAALAGNLCRCGAQPRMLRALRALTE